MSIKTKDVSSFIKYYEKYGSYNISKAIEFLFYGPFKLWLDYLTPEEKQVFNNNLLDPLVKLIEEKYNNRKINIQLTEEFKDEIILNDVQILQKIFFIYHII